MVAPNSDIPWLKRLPSTVDGTINDLTNIMSNIPPPSASNPPNPETEPPNPFDSDESLLSTFDPERVRLENLQRKLFTSIATIIGILIHKNALPSGLDHHEFVMQLLNSTMECVEELIFEPVRVYDRDGALAIKWRQDTTAWISQIGGALGRIDDMIQTVTGDTQVMHEKAKKVVEDACEEQGLKEQRLREYEMRAARLLDNIQDVEKRAGTLRPLTFAFNLWYILLSLVIGTYLGVTLASSV